jgi:hypothetical protein
MIVIRAYKAQKKRYRLEIKEGENTKKDYFDDYGDLRAINRWCARLHKLSYGSKIILSRWDKFAGKWVELRCGGKK